MMQGVNGFLANGYGPWRITQSCPAATHNSLRAALGKGRGHVERPKCECPRALDVLDWEWKRRAQIKTSNRRHAIKRAPSPAKLEHLKPVDTVVPPPDFAGGLCTSPAGMKIADGGQNDQASYRGIADRRKAKDLCSFCPLAQICREWVTTQESPAGSWGGVWGGLDPWNRKGLELIITDGHAAVIPYVHA